MRWVAAALLCMGTASAAHAAEPVWDALRAPGSVVVVRHSCAPGTFDPPDAKLEDCSTQRNLDESDRAQARRIGEAFRRNGILAYASDATLLDIACYPHGVSWIDPRLEQVSLDHAMWFHRPFRMDEWLLYAQVVPSVAAGRALARGSVFTRGGVLIASVVQQGLSQLG